MWADLWAPTIPSPHMDGFSLNRGLAVMERTWCPTESDLMGVKLISVQGWQFSLGKIPVLSTSLSSSCSVLPHQCFWCDCWCTQIMEPQILQGFFSSASLSRSWQLHGLSGKTENSTRSHLFLEKLPFSEKRALLFVT